MLGQGVMVMSGSAIEHGISTIIAKNRQPCKRRTFFTVFKFLIKPTDAHRFM